MSQNPLPNDFEAWLIISMNKMAVESDIEYMMYGDISLTTEQVYDIRNRVKYRYKYLEVVYEKIDDIYHLSITRIGSH